MRRLVLTALVVGFACGTLLGEPLEGPQVEGLPCGTCRSGLTCGEVLPGRGPPVCLRSCDAGCATGEACVAGSCQRPCEVVNDCKLRIVEQECVRVADAGLCLVRPCDGNAGCLGAYLCTRDRAAVGCQPIAVTEGYCRRTP